MTRNSSRILSASGAALLLAALALPAGAVSAVTVVVDDTNLGADWFSATPADTRAGGTVAFLPGPDTPPLGTGSAHLETTDTMGGSGQAKAQLITYDYIGTNLADIDAMGFWAYRSSLSTNPPAQTVGLNLEVDFVGDGTSYTTLVYEPIYNPAQPILLDTWQFWDAFDGGNAVWWSTKAIPGVCAFSCYVNWSTILANNPDAKIVGLYGFNLGSGWAGDFYGAADGLVMGVAGCETTYDFEPFVPPQQMKLDVRDALAALLPTGDSKDDQRIQKAIDRIDASLSPAYWASPTTLTSEGNHVFDREKQAVQEMSRVKNVDLSGPITTLADVDRALAQTAFDLAVLWGGDERFLDKSAQALAKGDAQSAKGKFDAAISQYKKAWEYAGKSL